MTAKEWFLCLLKLRYKATKCGHYTKQSGSVSAFGQTIHTKMPKNKNCSFDYCLDCVSKMATRCAWCGNPIFIGEPITLYTPNTDFKIPEYAVIYSKDPLRVVGCLSRDCADTGGDVAGFWLPGENGKGHIHRVPTIFETMLSQEEPSVVVINNTHDINEVTNPKIVPLKKKER